MSRKKSLLIGINYEGSQHALNGCRQDVENVADFLSYEGYGNDPRSQVILRDDARDEHYQPTGHNMLAAMDWLVSEPNTICFLHYSGHGGQVRDPTGQRPTGLLDTICPVDFEQHGQIDSDTLHKHLVSRMHPSNSLFVILDCCHSGSALELPFTYHSDEDGNVSMIDNVREAAKLMEEGTDLLMGGFSFNKLAEAKDLYAGATSFFRSMKHMGDQQPAGLGGDQGFQQEYQGENRLVTMFSGCRDEQTSADAKIGGVPEGAMSWAFLETMKQTHARTSYVQVSDQPFLVLLDSRAADDYTGSADDPHGTERL